MRSTHISVIHSPEDSRIFRKECKTLARAGYEVHLIVGGPSAEADGVSRHSISRQGGRPPARRQWARLARASHWAAQLWPSAYHLHDPHLIPLGLALKLCGAPVVYDVHEHYPAHARTKLFDRPLRGALKALMWSALEAIARIVFDAFVCASPTLATRFPAQRTVVVANLPLHREFASAQDGSCPYRDRSNTVVYIGAINQIRGFWEMAQAAELLPAHLDCRVRMVGPIRDSEIIPAVPHLEERGRVEVSPYQPHPHVIQELLQARVGLVLLHPLPNHEDAMRSNKLFEYMAAGLPVIVSDLPRWRELVLGLDCGLVVDPLDPKAIAKAIEYLLAHPGEAEAMGRRGREAVLTNLNWDCEGTRLLALYGELRDPWAPAPSVLRSPAVP